MMYSKHPIYAVIGFGTMFIELNCQEPVLLSNVQVKTRVMLWLVWLSLWWFMHKKYASDSV